MTEKFTRDELVERMVRCGELEVSGGSPEELRGYFAPGYQFHAPGVNLDLDGLLHYFESVRAAFEDRSIRRGVVIVEGNNMACQTWIEGTFVNEFTQSPVGVLAPNQARVTFELINVFQFDDDGRFTHDFIVTDNFSVLTQMGYIASS
jgi:predicted ester cyclase